MNDRVTIQNLTDLLTTKHEMSRKDAEAFTKEFFLLIEQALKSDGIVKIKGLGTFKLIDVDGRESVKINTGERFQIEEHTKVVFQPDASLRDTINKPFAHFETVILNENVILEDTPCEEDEEKSEEEDAKDDETTTSSQELVVTETPSVPKASVTTLQEEKSPLVEEEEKEVPTQSVEEQQEVAIVPDKKYAGNRGSKSPVPYLTASIIVALLLCGGIVLYLYYPGIFSTARDKNGLDMPPAAVQNIPDTSLPDTVYNDTIFPEKKDTIAETKNAEDKNKVPQPVVKTVTTTAKEEAYSETASYKITGTKATYTMKAGETLTKVSLRFYGTKVMWKYIVKYNQGIIKNPNNVPYGTTIKIPELTKE